MTLPTDFFTALPTELITHIGSFCDSRKQILCSEMNSRIKIAFDNARKELKLSIPEVWRTDQMENIPKSALANLVKRFPNIQCLNLAETYFSYSASSPNDFLLFQVQMMHESLMQLFQTKYPSDLRHITFCEIGACTEIYLEIFGRPQTLSLEILTGPCEFPLKDSSLNFYLKKYENLTSFTLNAKYFNNNRNWEIELYEFPKLEKVQLRSRSGISNKALAHLGKCRNLTELSIDLSDQTDENLGPFLSTNHGLSLKVLDLEYTSCFKDDRDLNLATKYLTDLELLFMPRDKKISDRRLVQLANNCKKLTTLAFNSQHITDKGLCDFAQSAPNLRKLFTREVSNITPEGLKAVAQYWPNLEALELIHFSQFNPSVLSILSANYKNLRHLTILGPHNGVTEQDEEAFVSSCKSLKFLNLVYFGDLGRVGATTFGGTTFAKVNFGLSALSCSLV